MPQLKSEAPQPFQYRGSKRNFARYIVSLYPEDTARMAEPFAGSAAVTLAAACCATARMGRPTTSRLGLTVQLR